MADTEPTDQGHRSGPEAKTARHAAHDAVALPSASETALLDEYHDLVDIEMEGSLSEAQATRLRDVEKQLDILDEQDPHEQAINARIRQVGDGLDAILEGLKSLETKA